MKQTCIALFIFIIQATVVFSQTYSETGRTLTSITLLDNNKYEIKEFTKDTLLIYKGNLSSTSPPVRSGKFFFYDFMGNVIATGQYNEDIPYGTWVYDDKLHDTIITIDYTSVWKYLETEALDYKLIYR